MERTIVIAYEDTPRGRDAVALGRTLAKVLSASPIVATVFSWPRGGVRPEDLDDAIAAATREHFDVAEHMLHGLTPRTRAVVDQSVGLGLTEFAEAEGASVVVVGSSQRGAIGRTLLGSTGESLLHGISAALAVAPLGYGERPAPEIDRVGVAYDGSEESRAALHAGILLARRLDRVELTLLGVADYPRYGYVDAWSTLTEGKLVDREHSERDRALHRALEEVPNDLTASIRLLTGSAGPVLAQASGDFDLILAGSRAYGQARRTLLGSTTRHLIAASECPVVVLPRGAPVDLLGFGSSPGGEEN